MAELTLIADGIVYFTDGSTLPVPAGVTAEYREPNERAPGMYRLGPTLLPAPAEPAWVPEARYRKRGILLAVGCPKERALGGLRHLSRAPGAVVVVPRGKKFVAGE